MFIQRLGTTFQFDDDYTNSFIDMKKKHGGSFDGVWLTTAYGFPPLSVHKEYAKRLSAVAEKFRAASIAVSMQLANSIGHGVYISYTCDCTGLSDANPLVDADGTKGEASYCWNGEKFREYLYEEVACYCKCVKPDILWIDDDFRAVNHLPVHYGCFCPHCIKKFNDINGYDFTREQLVENILHGDIMVRRRWIKFIRAGLSSLMRGLCEQVHRVSPDTEFGLQNYCNGAYTGYSLDFIFNEMKAVNGKTPHYRAGGGAYNDHNPNDIIYKNIVVTYQNSMVKKGGYLAPEIENTPDVIFGKTPAGTAFETSYYLANGANGMTYAMMMNKEEPPCNHEREFELMSSMHPYWERLANISDCTKASGITYFISKNACEKQLAPHEGFSELSNENPLWCEPYYRLGFPLVFEENDGLYILRPEIAEYMSYDEFENLKTKNVVLCGESVNILEKRGFLLPVKARFLDEKQQRYVTEIYTDNPVNGKNGEEFCASSFDGGRFNPCYLECDEDNKIVLGKYKYNFSNKNEIDGKISTMIISLNEGGNWAVFGYGLWMILKKSAERERILNVIDYISGGLGARILSLEQACLAIRTNEENEVRAVSVTNCTIGVQRNIKVLIRNACGNVFVVEGQYEKRRTVQGKITERGIEVVIPEIAPWSVCTIFVEKQ